MSSSSIGSSSTAQRRKRRSNGALRGGRQEVYTMAADTRSSAPAQQQDCHHSVATATTASLASVELQLPVGTDRPKGFLNVGNTCYANAVLQCLLSTALTEALLDPKSFAALQDPAAMPILEKPDRHTRDKCKWLTRELRHLCAEYHIRSQTDWWKVWNHPVVDPSSITKHPDRLSPCLRPYQQEDAHEFLRALLGTLVMNGQNKKLSSLFDGLLESSVTCATCQRPSLTRDRYMDVSLDIAPRHVTTLTDALAEFCAPETLAHDNAVHCTHCRGPQTAKKELRLATAPMIFVCHLKRFAVDANTGRLRRVHKHVHFPQRLDLCNYMSAVNQSRPPPYELVALLVHHGRTCDHGHYVAYIRRPADEDEEESWYRCNDDTITQVSLETVLAQPAYLLWYQVADRKPIHTPTPSPTRTKSTSYLPSTPLHRQSPQRISPPRDQSPLASWYACGDYLSCCTWNADIMSMMLPGGRHAESRRRPKVKLWRKSRSSGELGVKEPLK